MTGVAFPISMCVIVGCLAAAEWLDYLFATQPHPWVASATALGVFAWAWIRVRQSEPSLVNIQKGVRGEESVADVLEEMRTLGYEVLHDLPNKDSSGRPCNIDHALVGPAGVFVIETKYRSKPASGPTEVTYDGSRLLVDGKDDSSALEQARACAHSVRRTLKERGFTMIPVRAVVLFPGWYVNEQSGAEVWVLEPKRLWSWLRSEERSTPVPLPPEERIRIVSAITDKHIGPK